MRLECWLTSRRRRHYCDLGMCAAPIICCVHCAPLSAAPYDAAEALYAYIASPSPVHDALHAAGTAYAGLIDAHPLATKSAVSGSLHGLADLLCQRFDGSSDVRRTFGMTSWGLLAGPVGHKFYVALDAVIRFRGASARS